MIETIGSRLIQLRKNLKMSQDNVGQACGGLSKSTVSNLEKDGSDPSAKTLIALAELFGVSEKWIMTGQDLSKDHKNMKDMYLLTDDEKTMLFSYRSLSLLEKNIVTKITKCIAE